MIFAGQILEEKKDCVCRGSYRKMVWKKNMESSSCDSGVGFIYSFLLLGYVKSGYLTNVHNKGVILYDILIISLTSNIIVSLIGFSISISFTRSVTIIAAEACDIGSWWNLFFFAAMLSFSYDLLIYWFPITFYTKSILNRLFHWIIILFYIDPYYSVYDRIWIIFLNIKKELYKDIEGLRYFIAPYPMRV